MDFIFLFIACGIGVEEDRFVNKGAREGLVVEFFRIDVGLQAVEDEYAEKSSLLTFKEMLVPPFHKLSFTCLHHEPKAAFVSPDSEQ